MNGFIRSHVLIVLSLICGAPAPQYKDRSQHIIPGKEYMMQWGMSKPTEVVFTKDGYATYKLGNTVFTSQWEWDKKKRMLTIRDYWIDGNYHQNPSVYVFKLDGNLCGGTVLDRGGWGTAMKIVERRRK